MSLKGETSLSLPEIKTNPPNYRLCLKCCFRHWNLVQGTYLFPDSSSRHTHPTEGRRPVSLIRSHWPSKMWFTAVWQLKGHRLPSRSHRPRPHSEKEGIDSGHLWETTAQECILFTVSSFPVSLSLRFYWVDLNSETKGCRTKKVTQNTEG